MVTKLKNIFTYSSETISIDNLVQLISNNNSKEIYSVRNSTYKSKEYNKAKSKLDAFMPHGRFNSISKDDLDELSGYLYFDIDNLSGDELSTVKSNLIDFGANIVYLSPGGCGLHFMVKVDGLTIDNFDSVYKSIFNYFVGNNFSIDKSALGLARKAFLSFDKDIYFNSKSFASVKEGIIITHDQVSLSLSLNILNRSNKSNEKKEDKDRETDTLSIIPISNLIKDLKFKTEYEVQNDFNIEEIEYTRINIPKIIPDGLKHTIYRKIMIQLVYLNPNITVQQVYSYLYWINDTKAVPKMIPFQLQKLTINTFNYINDNDIKPYMATKKIHISDKYTSKQKAELGVKINAILRQNESISKINEARELLKNEGKKETRVAVAKITGLSIITVKRNWNKQIRDPKDELPEVYNEQQIERESKLEQLSENYFFDGLDDDFDWDSWQPKKISIDKGPEDEDWGESDGIEGLIECID